MEFMGTKEASEKWGIPQQTISKLCREKRIEAEQDAPGSPWRIPINTPRPNVITRKPIANK